MKFVVVASNVIQKKSGAIVLSFFEGMKKPESEMARIDRVFKGLLSKLIRNGEIRGKLDEVNVIHSMSGLAADRVVIMGLGKKEELTVDRVRSTVAKTCRKLNKQKVKDISIVAFNSEVNNISPEDFAQAITEGALLGLYTFRKYITKKKDEVAEINKISLICIEGNDIYSIRKGSNKGKMLAEATNLARDMVNEPANYMTPSHMAEKAGKIAKEFDLELSVLGIKEIRKLGMGALLGVAQGSCQPPKLIIINYKGRKRDGIDVALIGKGITFDSGGISIKPSNKLDEMKTDMAGGAAVIAAIVAIARLKLKINITVIVPAVENLPSGSAIKPGDVLTSMTGKTIEIISTDAEGRLILADAIAYVKRLEVKRIVDVATLTGACQVALGSICTGVFGNNQQMIDNIVAAGSKAGEAMWQMPMHDEYKEQNKSDIADIKNVAKGGAGAITAAQFLAEFVGNTPWVHLDIAGTSFGDKERKFYPKGATGIPVRTLVNCISAVSNQKEI